MNKRIQKKKNSTKCEKMFKAIKSALPGSKISKICVYEDDFFLEIHYKDIAIHYSNLLYKPNKILIEFEELVDKWRDWKVYQDIIVDKDLSVTIRELKTLIDSIYTNYEYHFVNSLVGRRFDDIDKLEECLEDNPLDVYNEFRKNKQKKVLDALKVHNDNIKHIKSCSDKVVSVGYQNGEYIAIFRELISDEEFNSFYNEASKIKGYLEYDFEYFI